MKCVTLQAAQEVENKQSSPPLADLCNLHQWVLLIKKEQAITYGQKLVPYWTRPLS